MNVIKVQPRWACHRPYYGRVHLRDQIWHSCEHIDKSSVKTKDEAAANMSTGESREMGVTVVAEQGEDTAEPPPTIYWAYK